MHIDAAACRLPACITLIALGFSSAGDGASVVATRFAENPLITLAMSPSLGDNANGPTIIRVPDWVERPLGRYYMYFAHHKGLFIRLAYADSIRGPWRIYEPGVLKVEDTAFYRPQPDPIDSPPGAYTHVASPEVYVDEDERRILLWAHGVWSEGQRWPEDRRQAVAWMREHGYGQFTQVAVSTDGLAFQARPAITREPYLRVFHHDGIFYGIARLGGLLRASTGLLEPFELGPDPFRDSPYARRVRHVALLPKGDLLHIFFSAIGEAPEGILHTTMRLSGDWSGWRIGEVSDVLVPEAPYECPDLPNEPSAVGEIDRPARQLRDPAVFTEDGRTYLFYTFCGEQGVAGASLDGLGTP
jgi:hypothetical protein